MNDFINQLAFGWYPYLAVTVLVVGSIFRFDANQFGWRSQSSQFLRKRQMMIGSNLFHMGILVLLMGHFVGLLTPINVFDALGVSHSFKQTTALGGRRDRRRCGLHRLHAASPSAPVRCPHPQEFVLGRYPGACPALDSS